MLLTFSEFMGYEIPLNREMPDYTDYGQIDMWAENTARKLSEAGVMSGSDGTFDPHKQTVRVEVAQLIKNFFRFIIGKVEQERS
jgi:hypothetical protein